MEKKRGKLTVYGGPMFAQKTTRLQEEVRKVGEEFAIAIKVSFDNRYSSNRIVNHDEAAGSLETDGIEAIAVDPNNPDLVSLLNPTTILLAIDEANFFEFEILGPEIDTVLNLGVDVVVAGLIYDIWSQEFGATKRLMEVADVAIELTARCYNCGGEARNTKRLVESQERVLVGGSESYVACCDNCL